MNRKSVIIGLLSVAMVSGLASCVPTIEKDWREATYENLLDSKEIEITLWHGFGAVPTAALQKAISGFTSKYPNIKVYPESKGGYDNLKKAISLDIATGNLPNVVLGYPDHFAEYINSGVQVPLNEYINHEDENISLNGALAMSDIYSNYMTENMSFGNVPGTDETAVYGLPFNKSTELLVYNKTFFDAYAANDDWKDKIFVPKTWDEVSYVSGNILERLNSLKKLNAKDNRYYYSTDPISGLDFGSVAVDDFYPLCYDSTANLFITIARQWNGKYTESTDLTSGQIAFNDENTKTGVQFFKDLYTQHKFAVPDQWSQPYGSTPFTKLQVLMNVGSSAGTYNCVPDAATYEIGHAPVPYKDAEHKAVIQQGTNLAMLDSNNGNVTPLEKLASWLLIKHLTGEGNTVFAKDASYLPVRASARQNESYSNYLNPVKVNEGTDDDPDYKWYTKDSYDAYVANGGSGNLVFVDAEGLSKVDAAKTAIEVYDNTWTKFVDPAFIGSSKVREKVGDIMNQVTKYGKSVQDAIDYVYSQLPAYVPQN